jgi:hypothetical protein
MASTTTTVAWHGQNPKEGIRLVTPEVGDEEENRGDAGGVYLDAVVLHMRPRRHGGSLATAAPSRDQAVATPSTTAPTRLRRAAEHHPGTQECQLEVNRHEHHKP